MTKPPSADPEVVADVPVVRRDFADGLRRLHLPVAQSTRDRRAMDGRRERERLRPLPSVAVDDNTPDKYALTDLPDIDCGALIHLCKGRCCRLWFLLSSQDLEEGVVRWNPARPYQIRQGADGYCTHSDTSSRSCGVYAQRPALCRAYDCRGDARIWSDFEKRIPAAEALPLWDDPEGE